MKDIKNYEGLYAITSCGKVWSYKSKKFLKPGLLNTGYLLITLCKNGELKQFLVHRLVAEAYLPNPHNLPQVNHKDEVKTHNWINNLEWCDAKYNNNYGTRNKRASKKVQCIETGQIFDSITEAANFINRGVAALSMCLTGKNKSCAGYHWKYIEVKG